LIAEEAAVTQIDVNGRARAHDDAAKLCGGGADRRWRLAKYSAVKTLPDNRQLRILFVQEAISSPSKNTRYRTVMDAADKRCPGMR